jgi:3-oxoacyl-[acyl-carrier-protein] synthase II
MMRLLIDTASTISCQNTFGNEAPFDNLQIIKDEAPTQGPVYKLFIPPLKLRRLSPILKLSLTTAIDCFARSGIEIGAIIIGTGCGCMKDTSSFLLQIKNASGGSLSPTAFIHSTHNTVSGQISLFFKNHGYNITHSQNNLSFEMSLFDCMNTFLADTALHGVLVGSADEKVGFLDGLRGGVFSKRHALSELSSSFVIRPGGLATSGQVVVDQICFDYSALDILSVMKKRDLNLDDYDVVLHSDVKDLENESYINYIMFSGVNLSSSAFAFHYAFELLQKRKGGKALIVNNLCVESTGFISLSVVE